MSAQISNYLVLSMLTILVSGTNLQGGNIIYGTNGYAGNNNGFNNYIGLNNGFNGLNNGYNVLNNGYNVPNSGYNQIQYQLQQIIGSLPAKLLNLPYSLNPILDNPYIRDISQKLGIQEDIFGKIKSKGGYSGQPQDNGGYIKLSSTTERPDFSKEPSTTLAPLTQRQRTYKVLLDAINGNPGATATLLSLFNAA